MMPFKNMTRYILPVAGFLLLAALFLRNTAPDSGSPCELSAAEVAAPARTGSIVLDVRTQAEYAGGHLPNAVLIDISKHDFAEKIRALDRNQEYIVYCKTGIRSQRAIRIMQGEGFTKLCNIRGGTIQLEKDGVRLVR
jgi:phage shock protein E